MKNYISWVALAAVALICTSASAIWDPDTDADLVFNMNFKTFDNTAHTTVDAVDDLVGTLIDYNTADPNVFGGTSKAGLDYDANFAEIHDKGPGAGVEDNVPSPNDCKVTVPSDTGVFDLGYAEDKSTWTFWFNMPSLTEGTIIRHASINLGASGYENDLWEIRIFGGKLHFYHKDNCLRMETASTLSDLGLTVGTWYHAAVVIDRTDSKETSTPTKKLSTKIYVDGIEVPVIVTSLNSASMNVDIFYDSPLWIGAGQREFDGSLDDVRLYWRVLTPLEVSILNQPDKTKPRALLPIPRSSDVVISTDLTWEPAGSSPAPTAQYVYFGTNSGALAQVGSGTGSLNMVDNEYLNDGNLLDLNTEYYWYVKSTISGSDVNGPLWSFTSETGKALNPSPEDGEVDVNTSGVDLSWTTPTAATFDVYLSKNKALVESNDIDVNVALGISDTFVNDVNTSSRGSVYYWRVNSTYPTGSVAGDIWSFRTKPYELVFNTADVNITYADQPILPYTCMLHSDGWSTVTTGYLDGTLEDGNAIAVFDFPSGFNYDRRHDIIVVPEYRATDINETIFPTPLAIHVTGNFYFDGRIQIAGDDILTTTQDITFARSGGYPGPKHNQTESVFNDRTVLIADYWDQPVMPAGNHTRFGTLSSEKPIFIPTDLAKSVFGPGQPVNPPYKGGGGGGYGGVGGDAGRGYFTGIFSGGPSYGDKEVPVPFGGSSGGWGGGSSPGGAAGGGGIEIVATGNVVFDVNSQINAYGGGQLCSGVGYAAGGGAGGSVRIIAGGSVLIEGPINASGGKGGDASGANENDTGGGGGGGRVAIFYGTTYDHPGIITADGGAKGTDGDSTGLAQDGENGTIFDSDGLPKIASAPTPKDGDEMVYCNPDPCTIQLKWYSGYGGTTDEVFCDTNPVPITSRGSVSATRGQHSVSMTVSAGNTYYMQVVTDGTVSSDIWSFKTVTWQCPFAISDATPHVGGPEWDFNHDCVLTFEDYAFFAENWMNDEFGAYTIDYADLDRFADEWLDCYNRTDGGCAGW